MSEGVEMIGQLATMVRDLIGEVKSQGQQLRQHGDMLQTLFTEFKSHVHDDAAIQRSLEAKLADLRAGQASATRPSWGALIAGIASLMVVLTPLSGWITTNISLRAEQEKVTYLERKLVERDAQFEREVAQEKRIAEMRTMLGAAMRD